MKKHDKHKEKDEKNTDKIKNGEEKSPEKNEEIEKSKTEKLQEEIRILKDTLLRKAAEFENYKKRTEAEISGYIKYASEKLIKELLPVFDDLNRSVESVEKGETKDFEILKKGIIAINDKFRAVLEKEGLKEIDILGKEFNVDTCDALLQVPRSDVKPHTVIDVVEKGYYLKDKIIRHAKVLVSAESNESAESENNNTESKENKE